MLPPLAYFSAESTDRTFLASATAAAPTSVPSAKTIPETTRTATLTFPIGATRPARPNRKHSSATRQTRLCRVGLSEVPDPPSTERPGARPAARRKTYAAYSVPKPTIAARTPPPLSRPGSTTSMSTPTPSRPRAMAPNVIDVARKARRISCLFLLMAHSGDSSREPQRSVTEQARRGYHRASPSPLGFPCQLLRPLIADVPGNHSGGCSVQEAEAHVGWVSELGQQTWGLRSCDLGR